MASSLPVIETLAISFSGPAFSFLLYDNLAATYSQEGFLVGEIVEKETKAITDNDQQQPRLNRVIKINGSVPCPEPHFFYDGIGRVDVEKVRNFLGDFFPKTVAWYKYKRDSSFSITFRENIIHRQLAKIFSIPLEHFTCCLLISESSENGATHSYRQTFMRWHRENFEEMPFHIVNLSDSTNGYKSPEPVSATLNELVKKLDVERKEMQGINVITRIQKGLQNHTDSLIGKVAQAERELFELEKEFKEAKRKINDKICNENFVAGKVPFDKF